MTPAESQRLEAEADRILKEDARRQGKIKPNGRGFSDYAREIGITTKKTLETTYAHEKVGFTEEQLGQLAHPAGLDGGIGEIRDRGRRRTIGDHPQSQ